MLDCGHVFHKACIMECLHRKFECVLCRQTDLVNFRVYCRACLKRYMQFPMHCIFR